jgi:hypothetical protein
MNCGCPVEPLQCFGCGALVAALSAACMQTRTQPPSRRCGGTVGQRVEVGASRVKMDEVLREKYLEWKHESDAAALISARLCQLSPGHY